jgi:hypothetical protein
MPTLLAVDRAQSSSLSCSMCGRDERHVRYLMAGAAGGHLCDACTLSAMKLVVATRAKELLGRAPAPKTVRR